jgi:hypothetical protein
MMKFVLSDAEAPIAETSQSHGMNGILWDADICLTKIVTWVPNLDRFLNGSNRSQQSIFDDLGWYCHASKVISHTSLSMERIWGC